MDLIKELSCKIERKIYGDNIQIISESAEDIPVRVRFRNPLGELVERICRDEWDITKYNLGDNYP
ncbi:MAG: hypothetical protein AABW83_02210 [Nanoarchaeota archaeon]